MIRVFLRSYAFRPGGRRKRKFPCCFLKKSGSIGDWTHEDTELTAANWREILGPVFPDLHGFMHLADLCLVNNAFRSYIRDQPYALRGRRSIRVLLHDDKDRPVKVWPNASEQDANFGADYMGRMTFREAVAGLVAHELAHMSQRLRTIDATRYGPDQMHSEGEVLEDPEVGWLEGWPQFHRFQWHPAAADGARLSILALAREGPRGVYPVIENPTQTDYLSNESFCGLVVLELAKEVSVQTLLEAFQRSNQDGASLMAFLEQLIRANPWLETRTRGVLAELSKGVVTL